MLVNGEKIQSVSQYKHPRLIHSFPLKPILCNCVTPLSRSTFSEVNPLVEPEEVKLPTTYKAVTKSRKSNCIVCECVFFTLLCRCSVHLVMCFTMFVPCGYILLLWGDSRWKLAFFLTTCFMEFYRPLSIEPIRIGRKIWGVLMWRCCRGRHAPPPPKWHHYALQQKHPNMALAFQICQLAPW